MDKLTPLKPLPSLCALAATLIIWFLIPVPEGVAPNAWQLLALFIGTIIAIIGKAMPIGAVSVIAIALVAVTGVTNPGKPGAALDDALSGFSNQLIWLIGFSIMISLSLNKTGLGARIGYYFISLFGKKTLGIAYALTLAETTLAPVTPSNTARGGGIIHPIMKSIADSFGSKPELNTAGKIGRYLSLVNYNINPVTSAMFITATAPNPLIVSLIAKGTHGSFELSWSMWAIAALVPGLCSLIVMPLVIYLLYPPEVKSTPDAPRFAREKLQALGPVTLPEKITLGVFALLLVLWAGIPAMIFGPALVVNPTTAALIGLAVLLATGVLGTIGQLLWTRALRLGEVSALTPISFLQLPLVTLFGWLLFNESVDRWTIIGAGIILAANAYIAHREAVLSRRAASAAASAAAKPAE